MCDLKIVLLGKNVSENKRVENSILGNESYVPAALQQRSLRIRGTEKDRLIRTFNTFHLLDPNILDNQITQTVRECVSLFDPGPHAFIIILQYNDFTKEDMKRVRHVLNKFSEEAIKHTLVLTTDKERHDLNRPSCTEINTAINELINECGGGHLQLEERKQEWYYDIFKNVDEMLKGNQKKCLTCEIYEDVIGSSVDEEQSRSLDLFRSEEEKKDYSHHKDDWKIKQGKGTEDSLIDIREWSHSKLSANSSKKLNLVLCGSDGSLKVSVSKLLRGKKISHSHHRENCKECVKREEKIHGRQISVVEYPALILLSEEEVIRQTLHCMFLCDPGVHVFLIIVPAGPLTDVDKTEIKKIQRNFNSREHLIVIFISDGTVKTPITNYIKQSSEFQRLISLCEGQYCVMGLKENENSSQIPELLDYIENMKAEPYSAQTHMKAQENRVRCETKEKYEEKLRKMKDEIQDLKQKLQSVGAEGEAGDQDYLRIVLIGRTGNGKSATGNTILGREEFNSQLNTDSVTTVCEKGVGEVDGRSVAVVDTPGLFDTTLSNEQVVEEIVKCVSLSSPGPHVFVIVVSLGRFTKEETDTVDLIKRIFGPKAAQFSIVLFTRGDDLGNTLIQQYVEKSKSAELKKLIRDCGNRFLVFNNREKQDKTQVIQLLNLIEEVKNTNQGRYFTNSMFEEAEMSIKKKMEEIMKEREREIQAQREELQAKYELEMKNMMKKLEEEKRKADEERMKMENQLREKEENLRKEFKEKETSDQKRREIEKQKQLQEEEQQRAEYHQKIEEMKREMENQSSQYEKQQKEREKEDRKREEKYKQLREKMKNEQKCIAELQMKQEKEIKKRYLEENRRNEEEEKERQRWTRKIKEAENDKKEIKEEIKRQQKEWEDDKKRQMREREEEEIKRKEKHKKQLREKQEALEKMRKTFEREREEERQKIEEEREKQRREREEKEREYEEKRTEMERHYQLLERERKEEWEKRKQEDDERREEERKRWTQMIEDLKQEQEEKSKRRESEERERKEKEEKERDEMKKKYENEIKVMKKIHENEARKQAEELNDFKEVRNQLKQKMKKNMKQKKILEKLYEILMLSKGEKELYEKVKDLHGRLQNVEELTQLQEEAEELLQKQISDNESSFCVIL